MPTIVTVFSDFADPFAYLTEAALRDLSASRDLEVRYRALELHPPPHPLPDAAGVARRAKEATELAAEMGLVLREPRLVPRTRKCHEAARFAARHGAEEPLRDLVHRAYWERGMDIGRIDVLASLTGEVGLDDVALRIELDIDSFGDDVRRDAETARRLGIAVVPTIYIGTGPAARILVGPQDRAALDAALDAR